MKKESSYESYCVPLSRCLYKWKDILDGILEVNEFIESKVKKYHNKKFKLDMEKAYDHLEWSLVLPIISTRNNSIRTKCC